MGESEVKEPRIILNDVKAGDRRKFYQMIITTGCEFDCDLKVEGNNMKNIW